MWRAVGRSLWWARGVVAAAPLVLVLAFPAFAAALEQTLTAADGAAFDQFGSSVAVDGDTAVVGASNLGNGLAVYVFTRSGDRWVQTAKLTASDGTDSERIGRSVAIDGDTIVAGAPYAAGRGAAYVGAAYVFTRSGHSWEQTAKLTATDGVDGDQLGVSVAIDGDTIVAGDPRDTVGANANQGSVYTFARSGAPERTETAKLTVSDGAESDALGVSVAIGGDTVVAGAILDRRGPGAALGAVYTFARTGAAERTQTAKLTASDGAEFDVLGVSVAIGGDTIVAGAPNDVVGANRLQGSAYTFARTGAPERSETAKLTASDGATEDSLGRSVAIDGETIVVGASSDTVGANAFQGSAYTFARTGDADRNETAKLTASDGAAGDDLGVSVAVDGDTILAGAPFDDVGANSDQGSVSIFFSPAPPPPPVATCLGEAATIVPAAGQTVITGTSDADVIVGADAGETINGRGGDDLICAGEGDDWVRGGTGDDRVRGGPGDDRLRGDKGDDSVRGGSGSDRVFGGRGDDLLSGGDGRDRLFGGAGDDRVRSADGSADKVDCGRGRDSARIDTNDLQKRCERVRI